MTTNAKRSWQLQEFMAHGANVNCLALGHKSGRVLATGGNDKKVNLWAIGKENCIMSLGGHLTPIECVKFAHTEDMVCAGSQAGTLKQWDLEAAKLFRTLTGHKDAIKCIDFHPYGDLLASGSLDASIKLWDCRKKASIFTFKGQNETVNSLKFSPDGQWIASGGEEGGVKLWDLRAGRILKELHEHSSAVTDVEFHPQEFLLATSSADRSISFWDLESFNLVSKSERETALIRCLLFSSDGHCLFGGCAEQVKVYGWEPTRIFDTVTSGWGKVQDMAMARDQLIGASFNLTKVLVCVVDISKVCRSATAAIKTSQVDSSQFSHGQSVRKSFNKQKPKSKKPVVKVKAIDEEYDTDEDTANFFIPNVNNYEAIFKPHRSLNRSPPLEYETQSNINLPSKLESTSEDDFSLSSVQERLTYANDREPEPKPETSHKPLPAKSPEPQTMSKGSAKSVLFAPKREPLRRMNSKTNLATQPDSTNSTPIPAPAVILEKQTEASLPDVVSKHGNIKTKHSDSDGYESEIIPSMSNASIDIRLEEFLPTSYRNVEGKIQQPQSNISDGEIVSSLTRNHEMVLTILKIRQRNLEIIYSLWHNQDLKCALEAAISMNDQAVLIDVLSAINKRPSLWNLDICVVLLPAISNLIQSKYEMYMSMCCESLKLILKNFSSVIKTNVQWSSRTIGVDISKEERYSKCMKCYESLISIRTFLLKKQTVQGKLGQSFREVQSLMYAIEK